MFSFRQGQLLCSVSSTYLSICFLFLISPLRKSIVSISASAASDGHSGRITSSSQNFLESRVPWEGKNPSFCKQIAEDPVPQTKKCMQGPDEMACPRDNESVTFSQYQQDHYLYTRHFVHLQRPGVYLDIGANDPVHISNTYFMDRCLSWRGICVEPNPNYIEPLYRLRSCHLAPTCVSSRDGDIVSFSIFGGWSGVVDENYKHLDRFQQERRPSITHRCTTMALLLQRTNVSIVDFMSLDVEGHEWDVLQGFEWDSVIIKVMVVEVSPLTLVPITEFLEGRGYRRHIPEGDEGQFLDGLLVEDAIFLHNTVEFGSPL